jgi:prepilin-type N-terminal cleavage/methylation domain-containing protein
VKEERVVNTRRTSLGFTLVELLVALVVGATLIGLVYQILVKQNRVYVVEEQNIVMQQDARAALSFMSRELRAAGLGVADDNIPATNVFRQLLNNASKGSEKVDAGTDSIMFTASIGHSSLVAKLTTDPNAIYVYAAPEKGFDFKANKKDPDTVDLITFHKGEKRKLNREPLKIKGVSYPDAEDDLELTKLVFAEDLSHIARGKGLEVGDQVATCPVTIWYRVNEGVLERAISDDGGKTWKTTQPLINNVDDLQLSYAFDGTDADRKPDIDQPAIGDSPPAVIRAVDEGATGVLDKQVFASGDANALDSIAYRSNTAVVTADKSIGDPSHNPLRSVRVSLVVHSSRQDPNLRLRNSNAALQVQDHGPPEGIAKAMDGYFRRAYERDVAFRNLGLVPPEQVVSDAQDAKQ